MIYYCFIYDSAVYKIYDNTHGVFGFCEFPIFMTSSDGQFCNDI